MSRKRTQLGTIIIILLVGIAFTALAIYVTTDRIGFVNRSLTAKAVVVNVYTPDKIGSPNNYNYYAVFQFFDAKTNQNVTAQSTIGTTNGSPDYKVGQEVDVLYNPQNPTVGVMVNSFWNLWVPSIALLPSGIGLIAAGIVAVARGKATEPAYPGQPLFSNTPKQTCQECGAKDSTVQLYMRYGKRTLMGMPLPTIARNLCAKCRQKYELEDQGLRICDHCGETIPFEGKCPNCGAT
jgi:hypothetical protein